MEPCPTPLLVSVGHFTIRSLPVAASLKVREFLVAGIEHFVDLDGDMSHDCFAEAANAKIPFLDRDVHLCDKSTITSVHLDEAMQTKLVHNETLGYFLARTFLFLLKVGVDTNKVRSRQHLPNEIPHYASDCWGTELLTSYGEIQCGGGNNRSAYDLINHSRATGISLVAKEIFDKPLEITAW